MHHIQRKILNQLMFAVWLGYAQMRPAGVESNHYAYHLEQLVRDGFVAKTGRQYYLTAKGLTFADRASHDTMTVREQPFIITSVHITNDAGQALLYKHAFQPYINLYGPPQGRIHADETIAVAAARELAEKTSLTGVPLRHRGMAYVYAALQGETVSRLLMHVFTGSVLGAPELAEPTRNGGGVWQNAAKLSAAQCMPGYKQIAKLLAASGDEQLFFAEIKTKLAPFRPKSDS